MSLSSLGKIKVKIDVKPVVENIVFRLHYRYTYFAFMTATLLSSLYGIVGSGSFGDVVNSYCFIMGTFTVDRLHGLQTGRQVPHPGVGPAEAGDSVTYHAYYQWVPFILFVQGVMFYVPHWLWKRWEGGLFKQIIQDLSVTKYLGSDLKNYFNRKQMIDTLVKYITRTMNGHRMWAYRFFFCELLNLLVVVATLFFTDWFLGGEFLTYGANVFAVASLDPEDRTDPMTYVFPRMAKCTFRSFGASGTIQVRDVMCLIATNIINEKIYLFLWVWLVLLTALTALWMLYRLLTILLPPLRHHILKIRASPSVRREVELIMHRASLSDWFILVNLSRNMEQSVFSEFLRAFVAEESHTSSTSPTSDYDYEKASLKS
ncbi:Innexin inx2 [Chionoecetes opilio]|uniref:Innexin n=1 Tax=Chionoecetes opilio TaxID=41210 RepID=A0A8J8W9R6_CHIOP|nr:Innexin inx2 [Chionoecetes opilio]